MIEAVDANKQPGLLDVLAGHERRFLAAYPDVARRLDPVRIREQIERRLAKVIPEQRPMPHLVVNDLLDPDFYRMLEAAWPADEIFRRDSRGRKLDLVPTSSAGAADARNVGYELLPATLRAVWDFFVFVVNRQIVGPWLARAFHSEIAERLMLLQGAHADGLIPYPIGRSGDWSYRPNVGRFMIRGNGYVLRPHLDSAPYLVTALMYFPIAGQDEGFGTILYTPRQPLEFKTFVKSGSTEYFDDAGIECDEAVRVPYRPNTLLAFPNTLTAAHGVVAPENGYRRVFQYHLSLKGDDEKV